MAERRMFARQIVCSDAFLDMPASARALYYQIGMEADDDGFCGAPKRVMRECGASEDDLRLLLAKRYLLSFASGVVCVKAWKVNNYIQKDRYKGTSYKEELATLTTNEYGAYTECIQDGYNLDTDCIHRLGKVRLGKVRAEQSACAREDAAAPPWIMERGNGYGNVTVTLRNAGEEEKTKSEEKESCLKKEERKGEKEAEGEERACAHEGTPPPPQPTKEEVLAYCNAIGYTKGEKFYAFFAARNFSPDWKADALKWKDTEWQTKSQAKATTAGAGSFDPEEAWERKINETYGGETK